MALSLGSSLADKIYLGATEVALAYLGTTQVYSAGGAFSAEAQNYFDRLDTAGDTTYTAYKQPLANYIDSLVTLGGAYWDDMKSAASFVGVGIQGITVPLRDGMPTLTNNNFVAADLDQLNGLTSNGTTKWLDLNKNATDLSLDDHALSFHLTNGRTTTTGRYMGGAISNLEVLGNSTGFRARSFSGTIGVHGTSVSETGLIGISRNNSADYDWIYETTGTAAIASSVITASPLYMFRAATTTFPAFRAATYTVGPALDLATLEGLQDTLITEIAAI